MRDRKTDRDSLNKTVVMGPPWPVLMVKMYRTLCHPKLRSVCKCCINKRPRWATLHPDHWTEREVAEWLVHLVDEYDLQGHRGQEGHGARREADRLMRAFARVTGRRLALMTLTDFVQLEPRHGLLLFTVFHGVLSAGRLGAQTSGFPPGARPLTPIREVLDSPGQSPRAGVDRTVPQPQEQPLHQAEPDLCAQPSGPESREDDK